MRVGSYDVLARSPSGRRVLVAYRPPWAPGHWLWIVIFNGGKLKRIYNPMLRAKI
jgi:hypothetical protein